MFSPGYRASWATVAGQIGDRPIAAATGNWRADHASWGGTAVAGVLTGTRRAVA